MLKNITRVVTALALVLSQTSLAFAASPAVSAEQRFLTELNRIGALATSPKDLVKMQIAAVNEYVANPNGTNTEALATSLRNQIVEQFGASSSVVAAFDSTTVELTAWVQEHQAELKEFAATGGAKLSPAAKLAQAQYMSKIGELLANLPEVTGQASCGTAWSIAIVTGIGAVIGAYSMLSNLNKAASSEVWVGGIVMLISGSAFFWHLDVNESDFRYCGDKN